MTLFSRIPYDALASHGRCAALLAALVLASALVSGTAFAQSGASLETLATRAVEAGADGDVVRSVVDRAQAARLPPDATADLLRPAIRLAEQDLPSTPVLHKALEGIAKRVPPPRMASVLQQLQSHTQQAGTVVVPWLQRADVQALMGTDDAVPRDVRHRLIVNVAQSQQQGVPLETVTTLLDALPGSTSGRPIAPERIAVALGVLPDLPGARTGAESTRQLVTAALDANYTADDLRQLPAALQSAQRASQRPADALTRGAARAIAAGTPASDVIGGLFRGSVPGGGPPSGVGPGSSGSPSGSGAGHGNPPGGGNGPPGRGGPPNDGRGGGPPGDGGGNPGNGGPPGNG